jgi:F420-0:gamma-glutamyl ligase
MEFMSSYNAGKMQFDPVALEGEKEMERVVGTVVRGIRTPIINQGDHIEKIVVDSILRASAVDGFSINDRDIVGVTESVVARAQGNYATVEQIAKDLRTKFGGDVLGAVFPILSRNRFAVLLKAVARSTEHVVLMLSYPADEVGNHLVDLDQLDLRGVNPWTDELTEAQFREAFGSAIHPFTGIDYIAYYRTLIEESGAKCTILLSNNPKSILDHTTNVLVCDIHTRARTKRILKNADIDKTKIFSLDEILTESVDGSGNNPEFGLLGSNKATEDSVKLFPRDSQAVVDGIQESIHKLTGKRVEVLVYGDGAFKDPVGKIWELADPVVSPAFTPGLFGTPNEVKIKYLADNQFASLRGEKMQQAITNHINQKNVDLTGAMDAQGTTPRRLTDLIGSLCDLTSGSGDKGTPVVYIQGYFDHYAKD